MMDLSDGLASRRARGWPRPAACGSCSTRAALPLAEGVTDVELAATGGEDYELLVCVPPGVAADVTWIGAVEAGEGVQWRNAPPGADAWRGFEH